MVAGKLVPHLRIGLHVSACVHVLTPVWVWFGRREDPHETKDLAHELPDVLESLKQRYLELKATALDQRVMLSKVQAGTQRLFPNWIKMLQTNKGFVRLEPAAFLHRGANGELSC